jgi:3-hydroxyisobutyrate dehydrogenase-like beta-hydroxyacid dehydrogenase
MSQTVGFIGLGNMGQGMAANLLKAGYKLRVYNRTAEKAAPLVAQGAQQVAQPSEAVEPGSIVITMLANDAAVEEIVYSQGFLQRLDSGIHLSMSTIAPATAQKLAEVHKEHGAIYLAAPVFGRPDAAAAQKLWICLAGPDSAKECARPVLNAMGQGIFDFGEQAQAANVVKLIGNFLLVSALEAMAEALTLAEKSGLERTTVIEMLTQTLFTSPAYQNYGKAIAEKRYTPAGFRLALGLKDIDLVLRTASEVTMPMPLASFLHDRMITQVAKGRGDMDWSALALSSSEDAGL